MDCLAFLKSTAAIGPLYVLHGDEVFLKRQALEAVRARALGFTYSGARTLSAVAPLVIGRVAQSKGLSSAFYFCALARRCPHPASKGPGRPLRR